MVRGRYAEFRMVKSVRLEYSISHDRINSFLEIWNNKNDGVG